MPAAAVIPAPIAYIKVVAVKKLVVGFRISPLFHREVCIHCVSDLLRNAFTVPFAGCRDGLCRLL